MVKTTETRKETWKALMMVSLKLKDFPTASLSVTMTVMQKEPSKEQLKVKTMVYLWGSQKASTSVTSMARPKET